MVRELLDVPHLAPSVESLVMQRAEGNPFFIEELTRYLREHALLVPSTSMRPAEPTEGAPDTIQALLKGRIHRLSEPLKYTLELASVLGREFPLPLLEALRSSRERSPTGPGGAGPPRVPAKELFPECGIASRIC